MKQISCLLRAAVVAVFLFPMFASAEEFHVFGWSYHADRSKFWCEDNPGVGYTAGAGYSAIIVRNSYCNWTAFVNHRWLFYSTQFIDFGLRAGVFWSEDDYLFGFDVGPAVTLEATFFDSYTASFLGEAVSFHYSWEL